MNFWIGVLTVIHVFVALLLIVLVLMQKSSEQGVGAAFGGGFTESVFGAGTTSALVRLTIWCACILLATTLSLAILHSHRSSMGGTVLKRPLAPAATETPASTPAVPPLTPATPGATESTAPATPVTPSVPATTTPAPATPASVPQPEQAK